MPAAAVIRASIGENEMAELANAVAVLETVPPGEMGAALAADAAQKAKFGTIHIITRGFL